MEAIVLCGGLGTRLHSVHRNKAKTLAKVGDHHFLDILLNWLRQQGITRTILAIGYLAEQIVAHVNAHPVRGMDIVFSQEEHPMGTGGALGLAAQHIHSDRVLTLNGDSLCPINITAFLSAHMKYPDIPIIAATRVDNAGSYGVIDTNKSNEIIGFHTQASDDPTPGLVNSGLYWLPNSCLGAIPIEQPSSLENDIFPKWVSAHHGLRVFAHTTPFQDIGTPERLKEAETFLQTLL